MFNPLRRTNIYASLLIDFKKLLKNSNNKLRFKNIITLKFNSQFSLATCLSLHSIIDDQKLKNFALTLKLHFNPYL